MIKRLIFMTNNFRFKNLNKVLGFKPKASLCVFIFFFLVSYFSFSQVTSSIDTTSIKIGEQITFKVQVETDTTKVVIFPKGQTFSPLEVIESFDIDTTKKDARYKLIKKYGLTQFDSGRYSIPQQKIVVGDKVILTDSVSVEVNNVVVDTTKQGLYDIKPIIEVEKQSSNWWLWLLLIILAVALVAFLLYWFIWRVKPLTEEEKVALLPPYERAKLAVKNVAESNYLESGEIKKYYSQLTLAIRKYIDEKVYNRALESTTNELVDRLNLLREGNQLDISADTIKNIDSIFKRADLVKFAKSTPDFELARFDKDTIDKELDEIKQTLPEPSEEEKLLNEEYKQQQEHKKKRRKVLLTIAISLLLLIATFIGFGLKYGFNYVKDTIVGNESKTLLEGKWVRSEYGFPSIIIETPQVLKRLELEVPEDFKDKIEVAEFGFGDLTSPLGIVSKTQRKKALQQNLQGQVQNAQPPKIDPNVYIEAMLALMEEKGAKNIITKSDKFSTPNGGEGIKTAGSADFPLTNSEELEKGKYALYTFISDNGNVLQQVYLTWRTDDDYLEDIIDRVEASIEVQEKQEAPKQNN
ncbi:hypothetical protein RM697_06070 [Ichthyenterobacterium sp. W332]|uniref:Protein BatD n=1 Tax=Microcosmobacter mediterraneus TaxID=3075607 RepID=A0ABU2YJ51_9FLAO|nr:hypothetical protein [Ichthyenterobacterium sp. W332]MDT0558201.1 hypothetical protein [Ichthyenterobacterium sp. W332]